MKKVASVLLSICVLLSTFAMVNFSSYANTFESALPVEINQKISNSDNKTTYYMFSAPSSGYYKLSLNLNKCVRATDRLEITVGTNKIYKDYHDDSTIPFYTRRWGEDAQKTTVYKDKSKVLFFEANTYEDIYIYINYPYYHFDLNYDFCIEPSLDYYKEIYMDGLYYNLDLKNKTATVIGPTSERYIYRVPNTISYNGNKYTVDTISDYAFNYCNDLEELYLPETIKNIGKAVFANSKNLKIVDIDKNGYFKYQNGVLYNAQMNELVWYPSYLTNEEFTIPSTVNVINAGAFQGALNLKNIVIPNSITSIDEFTFDGTGLRNIKIPNTVTYVGVNAFSNNIFVKTIDLGNSVKIIDENSFYNCSIVRSVTVPSSTDLIHDYAFAKCSKLIEVYINGNNTALGTKVFDECSELLTIFSSNDSSAKNYAESENIYWLSLTENCKHSYELINSIPASCESKGYKVYKCKYCKDSYTIEIKKLQHSYKEDIIAPTCTTNGYKVYFCISCDKSYLEVIEKSKHSLVTDKAIAPTYTKTGKTEGSHCSVCKAVIKKQTTVAKKTLGKPTSVKVTALSKSFKLTWNKVSAAKGYEIQYSTSSNFLSPKKITISSNATLSKTVTTLTGKKKYYVRIRSYYKDSNGTAYSSWVSTSVTTKK